MIKDFKFFNKGPIHVRYIGGQSHEDRKKVKLSLNCEYTVKYECNMLNNDGSVGEPCYYLEEMMNISGPCGRPYAFATRIFEIINK
jgi:hypothetical protein